MMDELVHIYRRECKRKLCDSNTPKKATNVVTLFRGLSLQDYCKARSIDSHSTLATVFGVWSHIVSCPWCDREGIFYAFASIQVGLSSPGIQN